jgi:hypothetical protein
VNDGSRAHPFTNRTEPRPVGSGPLANCSMVGGIRRWGRSGVGPRRRRTTQPTERLTSCNSSTSTESTVASRSPVSSTKSWPPALKSRLKLTSVSKPALFRPTEFHVRETALGPGSFAQSPILQARQRLPVPGPAGRSPAMLASASGSCSLAARIQASSRDGSLHASMQGATLASSAG